MSKLRVRVRHRGELSVLSTRYPAFRQLRGIDVPLFSGRLWLREGGAPASVDITALFIGKSGYGKSSTINALTGLDCMRTSAVAGCTREPGSIELRVAENRYLSVIDLPGIGESTAFDAEYLPMYADFIKAADVVVWMLRADTRDYSIDERAIADCVDGAARAKLLIALNCCDKVEPISRSASPPGAAQLERITEKVLAVERLFDASGKVVPISADSGWNLDALATAMTARMRASLREPSAAIATAAQPSWSFFSFLGGFSLGVKIDS